MVVVDPFWFNGTDSVPPRGRAATGPTQRPLRWGGPERVGQLAPNNWARVLTRSPKKVPSRLRNTWNGSSGLPKNGRSVQPSWVPTTPNSASHTYSRVRLAGRPTGSGAG